MSTLTKINKYINFFVQGAIITTMLATRNFSTRNLIKKNTENSNTTTTTTTTPTATKVNYIYFFHKKNEKNIENETNLTAYQNLLHLPVILGTTPKSRKSIRYFFVIKSFVKKYRKNSQIYFRKICQFLTCSFCQILKTSLAKNYYFERCLSCQYLKKTSICSIFQTPW